MAAIVVSSVLSIAVLLLVSGVAKLLTPDSAADPLALLPLPEIMRASWVRRYLPWAELVIAGGLVIGSGVVLWAATAASVVLFAVFTVFVTGAVTRGVPVPCGCFGRWSRAPMSWRTVVRNAVFTAVALLAFVVVSAGGYHGPVLPLPWWGLVAFAVPAVMLGVLLWSERPGDRPERFGVTRATGPTPPAPSPVPDVARSAGTEAVASGSTRVVADPVGSPHPPVQPREDTASPGHATSPATSDAQGPAPGRTGSSAAAPREDPDAEEPAGATRILTASRTISGCSTRVTCTTPRGVHTSASSSYIRPCGTTRPGLTSAARGRRSSGKASCISSMQWSILSAHVHIQACELCPYSIAL